MKKSPGFYRPSAGRLLLAAVIAWVALLALIILLDPHGAGPEVEVRTVGNAGLPS